MAVRAVDRGDLPVVRAVALWLLPKPKSGIVRRPRFGAGLQALLASSAKPLTISAPLTRRRNASSLSPV